MVVAVIGQPAGVLMFKAILARLTQPVAIISHRCMATLKTKIRSALRKLWMYSDERNQAIKNARVERGKYRCELCSGLFGRKEIQVDHIEPVGKLISYDDFVAKLFCGVSGLRVLCVRCHLERE